MNVSLLEMLLTKDPKLVEMLNDPTMFDPTSDMVQDIKRHQHFPEVPKEIRSGNDLVGVLYQDGFEVGAEYVYDKTLDYRIPRGYRITGKGIQHGESTVYEKAVIPETVMIVDNGRYPTYYKMRVIGIMGIGSTYVDDLSHFKNSKMKAAYREYIQLCVKLNAYEPAKIHTMHY